MEPSQRLTTRGGWCQGSLCSLTAPQGASDLASQETPSSMKECTFPGLVETLIFVEDGAMSRLRRHPEELREQAIHSLF